MTFDPYDPQPDYAPDSFEATIKRDMNVVPFIDGPTGQTRYYVTETYIAGVDTVPEDREDPEETYRLALESAQRWLNNYRLSPAMRLRALRSVVQSALSDATQ